MSEKTFTDAKKKALDSLPFWLPGYDKARKQGDELWLPSPLRSDRSIGSFSVNLSTGLFSDFASPDDKGDALTLYARVKGMTDAEAAKALAGHQESAPTFDVSAMLAARSGTQEPVEFFSIAQKKTVPISKKWFYTDGACSFWVGRHDMPDGKKEIAPLRQSGSGWALGKPVAPAAGYPLYNLDKLLSSPEAVFVLTEGEKAADAVPAPFIGVTWSSGAASWQKTNFSPLTDRDIIIWPDHDDPGGKCMDGIEEAIKNKVKKLRRVDPEPFWPIGFDIADIGTDDDRERYILAAKTIAKKKSVFELVKYGDTEVKPTPWLIKNIFEADSTSCVFGASGSGKSYLALDVSCCVASGIDFFGNKVKHQGSVAYIAGEGFHGLSKRVRAWEIKNETPLKSAPLYISRSSARLCDDAFMVEVEKTIAEVAEVEGTLALVVIDTWARNIAGDENDSSDSSKAISALDSIRGKYGCAMIVVHHTGVGATDRARGSSVLKASLDAEYIVTKDKDIMALTSTKMKDNPPPPPLFFDFQYVDLGIFDEDGDPVYSSVLSQCVQPDEISSPGKGKVQAEIEKLLIGNKDGIPKKDLRQMLVKSGMKEVSVDKALKQYRESGKIVIENDHYFWAETFKNSVQNDIY